MKMILRIVSFLLGILISSPLVPFAHEHAGKEHGGEEQGGTALEGSPRHEETFPATLVQINPTQEGSSISGEGHFTETEKVLKIKATMSGATPGKHGFHIHEKGDCGDGGNAAGGHFNPDGAPHGDLLRDGFERAHAGDLGNIEIGPDGKGTLEKVIPGLTLEEGKYGIAGRALILHEKEDDFGQPTGNAGARIACGTIPSS